MKLLLCEVCGDIIAPCREPLKPRWCACERHAVWWVDPSAGILRVCDSQGRQHGSLKGWPGLAKAWVIGLHNSFLAFPFKHDAESIAQIIDGTPDSYIFAKWRSVVIRIRPGESGDTRWAALPGEEEED